MAARRVNTPLDLEHLAEEVEDLGREQLHAVESLTVRILEHFLKVAYSPSSDPRYGWLRSIAAARGEITRRLTGTLERQLRDELHDLYRNARRLAALSLREHGEHNAADALPESCPFTLEQVMQDDWQPDPAARS